MTPETAILIPYALAVVVIALTPGPDMTFCIARTLAQGRQTGFAAMAGAFAGILVHSLLVALGLLGADRRRDKGFLRAQDRGGRSTFSGWRCRRSAMARR